jgi:hypothetical protein
MQKKDLIENLENIIQALKESDQEEISVWAFDETDNDWIALGGKFELNDKILDIL